MSVRRVYVEKRPEYAAEADALLREIREILMIPEITGVRVLNRYDVEGVDDELFARCIPIVFSEPQLDIIREEMPSGADRVLAVEYLPGQFDQRAASCEECIQLVESCDRPTVRTARIYLFSGNPSEEEMDRIRRYLVNPVEAREADLALRDTLNERYPEPEDVRVLSGFRELTGDMLLPFVREYGLAMDGSDLSFCRDYFREEGRDPTLTELRMIDTYWSDHCRHTTFLTRLDGAEIEKPEVQSAYQRYLDLRKEVYGDAEKVRPVTLMDIATIGAKALKKRGMTPNIDESEEINACSIRIETDVDGEKEPWFLMFKNETHNHPTEIEPFGGAATCIGGAIRDPLSGRAYVYQAMRVTGAADPLTPVSETIPGKLPQRKLCTTAAAGYSSYGNQIGLATGIVDELYHPGYAAKRLEIGAVIGATPVKNVRRERPAPGDAVVLLGGRTGRDGIGGATGSSKSHKRSSIETCGAEVQKGNAPTERKLQRLFRNGEVARLIKRCNDFGAGGVSVAIGELADGLFIDLDRVPRKYEGLDGTELAISESQERMAVVLDPADVPEFLQAARKENLEATVVAWVTEEPRLRMTWRGKTIVDVSREFLSSNGAEKHAAVRVPDARIVTPPVPDGTLETRMQAMIGSLSCCSRQGLAERFDSSIGAGTVLLPFGGRRMLSPSQTMVAKLPLEHGETETVSGMAYAFHPELLSQSPYEGSYLAVAESVAKLVAAGFDRKAVYLTLQEYFPRMTEDKNRWGLPFAALLGALDAEIALGTAAIGGKDSMSGTFENLDVPPTLCSFAVAPGNAREVVSTEFKQVGSEIHLAYADPFDGPSYCAMLDTIHDSILRGEILSAWAVGMSIAEGLFKMGLGNAIGTHIDAELDFFTPQVGAIILECKNGCSVGKKIGVTIPEWRLETNSEVCDLSSVQECYEGKLHSVFPYRGHTGETTETLTYASKPIPSPGLHIAKPRAFIPVFPGTNCEVDTARALERAGGEADVFVICNLTPAAIEESIEEAARRIRGSQMVILPGGFSGGDEPDGSAKFITAFFRNSAVRDAVMELMEMRDGLMLGICNGFQALVKLGLVPFGKIMETDTNCPTLTYNEIGRHQSMAVRTRVSSVRSPWLSLCEVGDIHTVAISHGEGRFVGPEALLRKLAESGQVATQYVNADGRASMDTCFNPNYSMLAIEGITSPDGRILGKMGHSERSGRFLYKNAPGNLYQPLFEGGVRYFR